MRLAPTFVIVWGLAITSALTGEPAPADIKVREERPRVFLRAKAWDGPSVEKIKSWMGRPEYQARLGRLKGKEIGVALYWLVTGDEAAGRQAVEGNKGVDISGDSPSYSGPDAQVAAAMYDWLHDHPGFDAAVIPGTPSVISLDSRRLAGRDVPGGVSLLPGAHRQEPWEIAITHFRRWNHFGRPVRRAGQGVAEHGAGD